MAIAPLILDYLLLVADRFRGGARRTMLEFGEAQTLALALETRLPEIAQRCERSLDNLQAELAACRAGPTGDVPFDEAQLIYRWLLGMETYRAVDAGARNPLWRLDLNYAFDLGETYDVLVNNGTSEHVFNQANFFEMMHKHAKPGALMVHYTPGQGWIDHGHYNIQPSFMFNLAKANSYEIVSCALVSQDIIYPLADGEFSPEAIAAHPSLGDSLICACLRRTTAARFRFPGQGIYERDRASVSMEGVQGAWTR